MERGLDTNVKKTRHLIFKTIAELAYHSGDLTRDIEELPYKLCNTETSKDYADIYREREVIRERLRLALGMKLRPQDKPVAVSSGVEESNIDEKYYEPPLIQVIPSACNACPENMYIVSDQCMGCTAHPCVEVCPKGAVSIKNGKSVINQEKCIHCGKCHNACPYDAISHKRRPCADVCGVGAIISDETGRADIDRTACVSCGQCMVNCPFGAIADKSQIFQLIKALLSGKKVIAEVAPSFAGQFGDASEAQVKAAIKELGFYDVVETAIGADIGCMAEAEHYVKKVSTGELSFLLTSCCPSWMFLAKLFFPETIGSISRELTPMVATARLIKEKHPDVAVVFIGPCASKKLEASRRTIRSDVDFVITYEELSGIFDAKGIDPAMFETKEALEDATSAGRGYGIAGGVSSAIEQCIKTYYPGTEVHIEHVEGLAECKKMLTMAKAGLKKGCLIEGMACPGGCIAGAGTNCSIPEAKKRLKAFQDSAEAVLPKKEP